MPPRPVPVDQLAMDERVVSDAALEQALEARLAAKERATKARNTYAERHEAAAELIARLELPEGMAVRVGRFRIAREATPARHVSFDTAPSSRVRIGVIGE